jgi:3-oxoacyl-[acyl-carrier protein] reductase
VSTARPKTQRCRQAELIEPPGVLANVINPGPVDTGWMSPEIRAAGIAQTPAGRLGTSSDTADLVRFLLFGRGSWINGQLLHSNGGFRTP